MGLFHYLKLVILNCFKNRQTFFIAKFRYYTDRSFCDQQMSLTNTDIVKYQIIQGIPSISIIVKSCHRLKRFAAQRSGSQTRK